MKKREKRVFIYNVGVGGFGFVVVFFPNSKFPAFVGFSLSFSSFSAHFFHMEKKLCL